MNIFDLQNELNKLGIPKSWYSINEGLKSDAHILQEIYGKWHYYYFDERGNRENEKIFENESQACDYIYKKLKESKFFYEYRGKGKYPEILRKKDFK